MTDTTDIPQLDTVEGAIDALSEADLLEVYRTLLPFDDQMVTATAVKLALAGGGGGGSQPYTVVAVTRTVEDEPYEASSGQFIASDPTDGLVEISLPASPTAGDYVVVSVILPVVTASTRLITPDASLIAGNSQLVLTVPFASVYLVFDGTDWQLAGQVGGTLTSVAEIDSKVTELGGLANINFSAASVGTGIAPYIGQADDDGNNWEIGFQAGQLSPEVDSLAAGITLGSPAKPWKDLFFTGQLVPSSPPVVPLTTPAVQDVIDALVALGLVEQSD